MTPAEPAADDRPATPDSVASGAPPPHRVVIVGGGFGGLYAVKTLRKSRAAVHITLVDRRNFHLFQPLLYQVASGWLSPSEIASPLRAIVDGDERVDVLLGEVTDIDLERREVVLSDGERIPYDSAIVAAGAVADHVGHADWAAHAPGLKTLEDAVELRRRILLAFEAAEREADHAARDGWLTFVVVGGGTTGVEMAGVLGELSHQILRGDFRHIDPSCARILLVQSSDRILAEFGDELAASAARDLARRGVTIRTGTRVTAIDAEGVMLLDKATGETERISARTVIWAAGVRANPLAARLAERTGVELDGGQRIPVREDLSLPGHPEVYVIGDMAKMTSRGREVPGLAPAAMQAGRQAARSIERGIRGKRPLAFRYRDKGQLATIGRGAAVAVLGPLRFDGFLAWVVWVGVHLLYLVEFANRLVVLLRWGWDFFRHERGSRLITGAPLLPALARGRDPAQPEAPDEAAATAGASGTGDVAIEVHAPVVPLVGVGDARHGAERADRSRLRLGRVRYERVRIREVARSRSR